MAANVNFKRGLLANLATQPLTDGHIYVTTDERAMYVDYNDAGTVKRIRLGDFIEVANQENLPALTSASLTALYYVTNGNMLVKAGYKENGTTLEWKQINSQLTLAQMISSAVFSASNSDGTVNIVETFTDAAGSTVTSGKLSLVSGDADALKISGSGNVVTFTPKDITEKATLEAPTYTDSSNTVVEVKLTNTTSGTNADGSDAAATETGGSFRITGTRGTTVSIDDKNNISITGGSVDGVSQTFTAAGKLVTTVSAASGSVDNGSTAPTPTVKYGENGGSSAVFASGTATLDVYTQDEVDEKISTQLKAVNAMTYKGTIGTTGATVTTLPTTGVSVGDTYKVNENMTLQGQACIIGDMWIASAATGKKEGADGTLAAADIVWTYIPSGNEEIITYTGIAKDGQFMVNNGTENILRVDEGDDIEITKTSDTVAKISHTAHETEETNGTAQTQAYNTTLVIPAVTKLTVNNGHVDGVETTSYTLKDTHNDVNGFSNVITVTSNVASVKSVVSTVDSGAVANDTFSIGSTGSLTVTATGKAISMDLQWGEF